MTPQISLETVKDAVDEYIRGVFANRRAMASGISASYERFWNTIETVAMVGGKRMRPYLTMIGYGSFAPTVVPIAAALEIFHCAMLMHDDIIDQDFTRRGQKNVSGLYQDIYKQYLDPPRATHHAISSAILAGDALLSEAYFLVATSNFDEHTKQRLIERLFTSVYEVIGGELIDVEAGFVTDTEFDPMTIYRYKTAGYSFVGPLLMGAYCAGADQGTIDVLQRYGLNAGIAFQIQDDLLGVYGDEQKTGKSTLTDLREAKRTVLITFHKAHAQDAAAERFRSFDGAGITDEELLVIKDDMVTSGARQRAEDLARLYFDQAKDELGRMPEGTRKQALKDLTVRLEERNS